MRFSDTLNEKEYPAWKSYYLDYSELKELLYDGISKAPKITNAADTGRLDYVHYVTRFDQTFFKMCHQELDKVNRFYKEKVRELSAKFTELKHDTAVIHPGVDPENPHAVKHNLLRPFGKRSAHEDAIKQSFTDLYLEITALSKYQELNYIGFRKILKKHDKLFGGNSGDNMLHERVETSRFYTNKQTYKLMEDIETIVTTVFEKGSRAKAMKRLRVPNRDDKLSAWTAFKLGLMMGTSIVLFSVLAVSGQIDPKQARWRVLVRFYRGPAVLAFYLCLIGINMYLWKKRGINHLYIFDLNPRDSLAHHHFWNISAVFGVAWALSLVLFLNSENVGIPAYVSPFALLCLQISFICNPFPCLYWKSRKWLWKILFRVFTAPFHRVTFADFWMADQMSSLAALTLDYQFVLCFFFLDMPDSIIVKGLFDPRICFMSESGKCACDSRTNPYRPILRALPSVLRMVQCLRRYYDNHLVCPHLVNAGKYFFSLVATIFSTLHSLHPWELNKEDLFYSWIAIFIVSSFYSFFWDVRMDWGLVNRGADRWLLRQDLLYPSFWYYYLAVFADFVLRFTWALSLSLTEMGFIDPDIMLTITTPAEIFRRFMWNLFRLEHEQINNNNAHRLNRLELIRSDMSFVTDEQQMTDLLHMMDGEDGVPKHRTSLPIGSSTRLSFLGSTRTLDNSRTELFTRTNSQDELGSHSEVSSIGNVPSESLQSKMKALCCCFTKRKNN